MDYVSSDLKVIHVLGGDCLLSNNVNAVFSTVLGSCVCACIYDPIGAVGGMNHFVLPSGGNRASSAQRYRYGDVAMTGLVAGLCRSGASPERLVARLFGGRVRDGGNNDPGALNAAFAKNFLRSNGIKLIEASLGDNVARWVTFHPTTGRTILRETDDSGVPPGAQRELPNLTRRAG